MGAVTGAPSTPFALRTVGGTHPRKLFALEVPCYDSVVPKTDGRRYFPLKVSHAGYDVIAKRAAEEADSNVSEMARRLLKYASIHMPKGWR